MKTATFDFSKLISEKSAIDRLVMKTTLPQVLPRSILSSEHRDMLDIGRAIMAADRFTRRHSDDERTEARRISVIIPVRAHHHWNRPEVHAALTVALNFLAQDDWDITFVPRLLPAPADLVSAPLLTLQDSAGKTLLFGLYSGGADSLMGTVMHALDHPEQIHVVIAATGSHLNEQQALSFGDINSALQARGAQRLVGPTFHTQIDHSVIRSVLNVDPERKLAEDYSQRTRGFLFLMLGAVVTASSGGNRLHVYENGPGAINLPYTRASTGADHTRSMHPRFIALMETFLSHATGSPFTIHNPYWFKTKGEMAQRMKTLGVANLLAGSVSCERFNTRGTGGNPIGVQKGIHCGKCTSCLLRQVSLRYAGVQDSTYTHALEHLLGDDRLWLGLMQQQAETIDRALQAAGSPFVNLLRFSPDLRFAVDGLRLLGIDMPQIQSGLPRLYQQYALEWQVATRSRKILMN